MISLLYKIFRNTKKNTVLNTLMSYSQLEKAIIDIGKEYQNMITLVKSENERNELKENRDLDIAAIKQLWNESVINFVSRYLKIMGYDISYEGKDIAIKQMVSGYNEIETASFISMVSMALDIKKDMDITRLAAISIHAYALLKILKEYKELGLIRKKIWENDSTAIFNISTPSQSTEEWIDKILDDKMIKNKQLATSRIN